MFSAIFTILLCIFFSIISTAIISYIAVATPVGPWMEMTLALLGIIICNFFAQKLRSRTRTQSIAYATAAGGIAGAITMACAFSFPTLYFLNPAYFSYLTAHPLYFCLLLAALICAAGSFGILIAQTVRARFLADEAMIFPIAQMVHNLLQSQTNILQARQLALGAFGALSWNAVTFIPTRALTLPSFFYSLHLELAPMLVAIGFTTGHIIAVPLLVAVVAKNILIDPIHHFWFASIASADFIIAFASGMALHGTVMSFFAAPKNFYKNIIDSVSSVHQSVLQGCLKGWFSLLLVLACNSIFLYFFSFGILAQLYLIACTIICAYQLILIAAQLGIAPIGRFATFVMIPAFLSRTFDDMQITLIATFVEIAGIVAVDYLFGQKIAQLTNIDAKKMGLYQWLGLLICASTLGVFFLLLIGHFGLGSPELVASRAQNRALLMHAFNFDLTVLALGYVFSMLLKYCSINSAVVFGGFLMGSDTSLFLIAGGFCTYLFTNKEEYYPFFTGVYATSSLWIFTKIMF